MITINGLTSNPNQTFRTPIEEGTITFNLRYKPTAQMWFIDVQFGNMSINGFRLVNSLNLYRQYRNLFPFGLYVQVPDGGEPFLINDFTSGRVILNVLTADEVEELESAYRDADV